MPATLAILSIVFVESIFSAAGVTDQAGRWEHKLLSVLVLGAANGANSISTTASTRLNNFFVVTKFVSIVGVVVAAAVVVILGTADPEKDVGGGDWSTKPWFRFRDSIAPDGSKFAWSDLSTWETLGHFSAALYGALWAYSGWDKVSCNSSGMQEENTDAYRPIISRLNSLHQPVSSPSLSIPPSLLSSHPLSLQTQPTISSSLGTPLRQPTVSPW
jgi:amino acid transporter